MEFKHTRFWRVPIGETIVWPTPVLLSLMGHIYAFPKAGLGGTGPGWHIALLNDRTILSQHVWHVLSRHCWLFIANALVLIGIFVLLRIRHVPFWVRVLIFLVMAMPGFWYSWEMAYLGGKLLFL